MVPTSDRRDAVAGFRHRLAQVIARSGLGQAAFARSVGLDRSTLAQLLADDKDRLPRAETLNAIAAGRRVSVDWLLGLSQHERLGGASFGDIMQIERPEASPIDAQMFRWMTEAAGYRIRTVPSFVPDLLKTDAVIAWEYPSDVAFTLSQVRQRLDYLRRPETEIELCCSRQAIEALARGEGIWAGLPQALRQEQLAAFETLTRDLYPSLRLYLYDLRRTFSVPFTVFGPKRVAIFMGGLYFVFTSNEYIQVMMRRFDDLIRAAVVQPPDVPGFVAGLR